jgi:hypothetical protein
MKLWIIEKQFVAGVMKGLRIEEPMRASNMPFAGRIGKRVKALGGSDYIVVSVREAK